MMCSLSAATIAFGVSLSFSTSEASPLLWGMDAWMFISPTMLEAPRAASSRTAEGGVEPLVRREDAGDRLRVRRRVPLVELERAAEDDPIGAREHVARASGEGVAHLGLRFEDRQLTARRAQVLVAEQLAAAKAGAIEHDHFRKCSDICGCGDLADLDHPAGDLNVAKHLTEIAPGFDVHRVVAHDAVECERMLGGRE